MTIELYDAWLVDTLEGRIQALENERSSIINRQIALEEDSPLDIPTSWIVLENRLTDVMEELEELYNQIPSMDLNRPVRADTCCDYGPGYVDDFDEIPF